jgi:tripartite-type tricarboxylate transporter receptor subunit TctC
MMNRRDATRWLASTAVLACAGTARAQAYPSKPLRWIVPYPAGGGSDFVARVIGQQLSEQIKQPVEIYNKPGGNTAVGAVYVAHAPADGYTILSADNGTMVFNAALYSKLNYNPDMDLTPVTLMGNFPMVLMVGQSAPFKNALDFITQAKAKPGQFSYGSAGAGSPHHLAMELLQVSAGLRMVHIPYRGAAPSLTDLVGGRVAAMMTDLASGTAFLNGGKIRPLAVANPTRLSQLPDVPTFAELGYANVVVAAQVGIVAPSGTPPDVISTLQQQVAAAIRQPAIHQKLVTFGIEPVGSTPQEYAALNRAEEQRWHKLIRDLKISLD